MYGCESWTIKLSAKELMLLNCGVGEDSWESLGLHRDPTSPSERKSVQNIHCKDWCWNRSSNTLATWCKELPHWKRPWCWEGLRAGGEVGDRGWDGWMASLIEWTWVWTNSGRWWRTGKPDVLQAMRSQRVGRNLPTEQQQQQILHANNRGQSEPSPNWIPPCRVACFLYSFSFTLI